MIEFQDLILKHGAVCTGVDLKINSGCFPMIFEGLIQTYYYKVYKSISDFDTSGTGQVLRPAASELRIQPAVMAHDWMTNDWIH
jgi:hypothetical protein